MEQQLKRLGMAYEIYPAVDGQKLTADELALYSAKEAKKLLGRKLPLGDIGCSLSHFRLYQALLASDETEFLILEDDINIGRMFPEVIQHRERLPADWEFINFVTDVKEEPFGPEIHDIYRATRFLRWANRTAATLVNKKGAKKLVEHALPIRLPADGLTGRTNITGLVSYGIFPRLITTREIDSTIERPPTKTRPLKAIRGFFKAKRPHLT